MNVSSKEMKESRMATVLAGHRATISELEATADRLHSALNPVRSVGPISSTSHDVRASSEDDSPMAQDIIGLTDRVTSVNDQINALIETLDI